MILCKKTDSSHTMCLCLKISTCFVLFERYSFVYLLCTKICLAFNKRINQELFFYQYVLFCLSFVTLGVLKVLTFMIKITEGTKQVENEADTFFFSNLNTPKTTIGGKASLQPKRTPVSNEEMQAILVRYLLLLL